MVHQDCTIFAPHFNIKNIRMKKQFLWLLTLGGFLTLFSCTKSAPTDEEEDASIKAYIAKKGWTAQSTPEGVYYVTDVAGTGTATPALSNIVKVYYKGYLLSDETVFDSNLAPKAPIEFPLSNLIKGWQIGFQKFKAGSKGKLIIPSRHAYGTSGSGGVPSNAILVFDVELVSFR
jgi:FKBP-type peptidyl-prolyl cis-trans isomerase FkpA